MNGMEISATLIGRSLGEFSSQGHWAFTSWVILAINMCGGQFRPKYIDLKSRI